MLSCANGMRVGERLSRDVDHAFLRHWMAHFSDLSKDRVCEARRMDDMVLK